MSDIEVSVLIPTWNGGELLDKTLKAIFAQRTRRRFEVVVVDSGSDPATLEILRRYPIELTEIPNSEFNHGLTRDLLARRSRGSFLLFLNQDATPGTDTWLDDMVKPLVDDPAVLAVQGDIRERDDVPRFFWDSCGPRFYFTAESEDWIRRHHGIGFSTVNCAIRRSVWEQHPFGEIAIFEDKAFQRRIHATGAEIARSAAFVLHTHDYDLRQLRDRCLEEGFGWRLLGEHYSWWRSVADMLVPGNYVRLLLGLVTGRVRKVSEVVFPFMRPRWLYRGNSRVPGSAPEER